MQDSANPSRLGQVRRLLLPSPAAAFRSMDLSPRDAMARTGGLFRRAFSPERADPRVLAAEGPADRFKVALFLAGRSERDLPTIERHSGALFETYAMLTIVARSLAAGRPRPGPWRGQRVAGGRPVLPRGLYPAPGNQDVRALAGTLPHPAPGHGARARVPARPQRLAGRQAPAGHAPARPVRRLGARRARTRTCAGKLSAVQSTGAALNLLTTAAGAEDLSLEWLRTLFPGMADMACPSGGTCTPSTGDALSAMFGTLNAVLLGVGSLVLGWHTLAGTVAAAHEGKVMGQKYHLMWAPVRVILGFGLLVPIRGYCGAQFAMIMVLVWGYNLANGLWSTYVDAALSGRMASVASSTAPQMGMRLAQAVVASETCVAVLDGLAGRGERQR